jgi:hypothetical protein
MDILAPVFGYLTFVAGIVGGFFVAFSLVFSPPSEPSGAQRSAAVVSATQSKGPLLVDAKKPALKGAVADNSAVNHAVAVAPTTQKRETTAQAATSQANSPQAMPTQVAGRAEARRDRHAAEVENLARAVAADRAAGA